MARYPLNLPTQLKQESEKWAAAQGVSLNQFVMWAVAEKVGMLNASQDDPRYPHITYRRGARGIPTPVVRGTGIRVAVLVIASQKWELSAPEIAQEYDLSQAQVQDALDFYQAHREEIDHLIELEQRLETEHVSG